MIFRIISITVTHKYRAILIVSAHQKTILNPPQHVVNDSFSDQIAISRPYSYKHVKTHAYIPWCIPRTKFRISPAWSFKNHNIIYNKSRRAITNLRRELYMECTLADIYTVIYTNRSLRTAG